MVNVTEAEIHIAVQQAYQKLSDEKGIPLADCGKQAYCHGVSVAIVTYLPPDAGVFMVSRETDHGFVRVGPLVIDAQWKQFAEEDPASKPDVLLCHVGQLSRELLALGVHPVHHVVWTNSVPYMGV